MTRRPLSTISFNNHHFLHSVCDELVETGKIQSYMYIKHKAEKDTAKPHIHLILIPTSNVEPSKIRKLFIEPVRNDKPLGCLPFVNSKVGDWLLYALHDSTYLLKKGLLREYHYQISDIETNETIEYVQQIYNDAKEQLDDARLQNFLTSVKEGDSFGAILASGLIPPNQIIFYDKLYRELHNPGTKLRLTQKKFKNL